MWGDIYGHVQLSLWLFALHCEVRVIPNQKVFSMLGKKKGEDKVQYRRFQGSVSLLCCQEFKAERSLSVSGVNPFCLNLTESL